MAALIVWVGLPILFIVALFPRTAFFLILLLIPMDLHLKTNFLLNAVFDPARLVVAGSLAVHAATRRRSRISRRIVVLTLLYVAAVVGSLLYAQLNRSLGVPYESLRFTYELASYLALAAASPLVIRNARDLANVFWVLVAGLVVSEIYGIYQWGINGYGPVYRWLYPLSVDLAWLGRPPGLLAGPNNQAAYINLVLPLVAAVGLSIKDGWIRLTSAAVCVLSGVSLFLTQSRGAWAAAVLMLFLLFLSKSPAVLRFPAAVLGAFFGLATAFFVPAIASRLQDYDISLYSRLDIWRLFTSIFLSNPALGAGYGSFGTRYADASHIVLAAGEQPLHAHDLYLQLLAETGVIGFLAFSLLVCTAIASSGGLSQAAKRLEQPLVAGFYLGIAIALVGFLAHGIVDVVWYSAQVASLFWILVAITALGWRLLGSEADMVVQPSSH